MGFSPHPFHEPFSTQDKDSNQRRYAAPEVLRGERIQAFSDIYSIGLIAYELFTGRPLLPRGTVERTIQNQVEVEKALSRVVKVTRSIPLELSNVIRSMIAIDPTLRPPQGQHVLDELLDLLPDEEQSSWLKSELGEEILPSIRSEVTRLLKRAHRHCEATEVLSAAVLLRQAAAIGASLKPEEKSVLKEVLRNVLWHVLGAAEEERGHLAAVFQLYQAAKVLGYDRLEPVLAYRFRLDSGNFQSFEDVLPSQEDLSMLTAHKPRLLRKLLENSCDPTEALVLATMTPEFRPEQLRSKTRLLLELRAYYSQAPEKKAPVSHSEPPEGTPPKPGEALGSPQAASITDTLSIKRSDLQTLLGRPAELDSVMEEAVSSIQLSGAQETSSAAASSEAEAVHTADSLFELLLDAVEETQSQVSLESQVSSVSQLVEKADQRVGPKTGESPKALEFGESQTIYI